MKAGDQLHTFTIIEVIGHGGMGGVFVGKNTETGELVAIKTLFEEFSKEEAYVRRFQREASVYRKLNHPNIVRCIASGFDKGTYFIAMEHIRGKSLDVIIKERSALGVEQALKIMDALAGAVYHAHSRGVIHRDIKPQNIMIDESGVVKLLDFGVAQADDDLVKTASGSIVGTFFYSSPEQNQGQKIDERSDLYSLGLVFYELLVGKRALNGATLLEVSSMQLQGNIEPPAKIDPGIPPHIDKMVMKLLDRDPNQRYQSAKDLQIDIKRCLEGAAANGGKEKPGTGSGNKEFEVLWSQAREAFSRRDLDRALSLAIEVSRLKPENSEVHCLLGKIYAAKEFTYNAIEEFKKTLALEPGNCQYKLDFAVALFSMKMIDRAREEFEKVLEIDPANPFAKQYLQLIDESAGAASGQRGPAISSQMEVPPRTVGEAERAIIPPPARDTDALVIPPPQSSSGQVVSAVNPVSGRTSSQPEDAGTPPPVIRPTDRGTLHVSPAGRDFVFDSAVAPETPGVSSSSSRPEIIPPPGAGAAGTACIPPPGSVGGALPSAASSGQSFSASGQAPEGRLHSPPDGLSAPGLSASTVNHIPPPKPVVQGPPNPVEPPERLVQSPAIGSTMSGMEATEPGSGGGVPVIQPGLVNPGPPSSFVRERQGSPAVPAAQNTGGPSYVPPPEPSLPSVPPPGGYYGTPTDSQPDARDSVLGRVPPPGLQAGREGYGPSTEVPELDDSSAPPVMKERKTATGDELAPAMNPSTARLITFFWWGGGYLYTGRYRNCFWWTLVQFFLLLVMIAWPASAYIFPEAGLWKDVTLDLGVLAKSLSVIDNHYFRLYVLSPLESMAASDFNRALCLYSNQYLGLTMMVVGVLLYVYYELTLPALIHRYTVLKNLTGKVLEVRRDLSVKINLGEERGVQVGQIFVIQKKKHINQVQALNFKTMVTAPKLFSIGEAKVTSTTRHFAICKFRRLPGETSNPSAGDRVILLRG